MTEHLEFTNAERELALTLMAELKEKISTAMEKNDEQKLRHHLMQAIDESCLSRDIFGLNPLLTSL